MHDWNDGSSVAWWWMLPMMLVFLVAVIGVAWALLSGTRAHASPGPAGPQAMTAEDVLAHRLARGEIDTAEYSERVNALRQHAKPN